jgi:hypothetical protein
VGHIVTIKLHLGVIELPYALGKQTTGEVAQYLENKYHPMEIFAELHGQEIAESLANTMADALDHLIQTGKPPARIFPQEGQPEIQRAFNEFIDRREMDGVQPGVPTAASGGQAGQTVSRNLRKKRKLQAGSRPSFKDTGLYEQSFRAWVEET